MLDKKQMKAVVKWAGPPVSAQDGHDILIERWAAKVERSSGLSTAACEFLEKAYAGELVFYCGAAFSQPETRAFRLAIRVQAFHVQGRDSRSKFLIQGYMLPVSFFFQTAKRHHIDMLTTKKLGLVWDLDQTLVHV